MCVFIIIFTVSSFSGLIHGLVFYEEVMSVILYEKHKLPNKHMNIAEYFGTLSILYVSFK